MPDFEFQPWERLTPQVQDAPTSVKSHNWLFLAYGDFWFARRRQRVGTEWNYIFPPVKDLQFAYAFYVASARSPEDWFPFFKQKGFVADFVDQLFRVWQWREEEGELPLSIAWHPRKKWLLAPVPFHQRVQGTPFFPFALDFPQPVEKIPSSALFSRLKEEWGNPDSDLRFSAYAASLTDEEFRLLAMQTTLGTPQQLAHLLRVALRAFVATWPVDMQMLELDLRSTGSHRTFVFALEPPLGIRERAILNHILRAFEPRQVADSPAFPSALRTLTQGDSPCLISLSAMRPSMHEQLESALELRSWLQQYWPEGVRHLGKII